MDVPGGLDKEVGKLPNQTKSMHSQIIPLTL